MLFDHKEINREFWNPVKWECANKRTFVYRAKGALRRNAARHSRRVSMCCNWPLILQEGAALDVTRLVV